MASEEFDQIGHAPTVPDDTLDPPRFSQIIETTKDAFVLELRRFFDITNQTPGRLAELPTIEKYAIGFSDTEDPYETTVQILQEFPDVLEQLPHISVSAGGGRNKRMTLGRPYIATVQDAPRVDGTAADPFALADGEVLVFRTKPNGVDFTTSTIVLTAARFPTTAPITAANAEDLVRVINEQALHVRASTINLGGSSVGIRLTTGGPGGGRQTPNAIEILSGTSANVLTALGFTVGQSDDSSNTARPPANRYHQASEVTVHVDIIAADTNGRRELADLVYGWATFWLERQYFEMHGRSIHDESVLDEFYQVILHQETAFGGEQDTPRPNDQKDRVHIQRITVPVTTIMYLDRAVVTPSGANQVTTSPDDVTENQDLPTPN